MEAVVVVEAGGQAWVAADRVVAVEAGRRARVAADGVVAVEGRVSAAVEAVARLAWAEAAVAPAPEVAPQDQE